MSVATDLRCPQCGATACWKYGRDPQTKAQKYRCKKCLHQFVPGRQRLLKYPELLCPRCGSRMYIFKHCADTMRFRCSRYKLKGSRRCTHKINLNPDGSRTFHLVTQPDKIKLVAGQVDLAFHWNRMKFSTATVTLATYYTICEGLPAPQVVRTLWNLHRLKISHDTITRWHHKAAFRFSARTIKTLTLPQKPGRKPRLYADETERKVRGHKRWFWLSYCRKYDLMLGRNLTQRRSTQSARDLLAMTYTLAPSLKSSPLLTDGLWSYPAAMGDLNLDLRRHLRYLSFFEAPNNNALERKWSNFHVRAKPFRGFKSDLGQLAFIEGQIFFHNCLKPSVHLGGKQTPYQYLNAKLPKADSQLELIAKLLTR